jgi:diguanylate cyclase (GGDEF)-like protein
MTLFKQLFIAVSLGFLFLLAGIELIYINNARIYLQDQLASHSQDAATSLSMVLSSSMADDEKVRAETIVSAVFDRGYYQSILVITTRGETVVYKNLSPTPPNVPDWFTSSLKLEAPVAEAMISKGWRQLGRVIVSSHPQFAYQQLWRTTVGVSLWLLVFYVVSVSLLYIFLKIILQPLVEIEHVADCISNRDFKTIKANPRIRELRTVVKAINALSVKIRSVIESEVSNANHFRAASLTDDLTKLDNRRSFEQQLQTILDDRTNIDSGTLFMIQIANFKEFNSAQGYRKGDELLKLASSIITSTWPERNFIRSRINGATFAIFTFNLSREALFSFGQELCAHLVDATESNQFETLISFGCGGTFFRDDEVTLGGLLAAADMATLQSLSKGNNKLVMLDYPADENIEKSGSLFWKQIIVSAINDDRFTLLAQPVIALNDSSRLQYEIVGRLINADGELVPASTFMPMAIRHNLNAMVDLKLMEKILRFMGEGKELANQLIAINLSVRSIKDSKFVTWLSSTLSEHPEIAHKIVFEFSEFGVVHDLGSMGKFAEIIRRLGANFAVDNFGLHHSAFDYLQTLRPAYIKLNSIFIKDLLQTPANQFFISSVVKITKPLEIRVFAHGIENSEAFEMLKELGVDGYQGYATGSPTRIG